LIENAAEVIEFPLLVNVIGTVTVPPGEAGT
jgi:hypothetical protein